MAHPEPCPLLFAGVAAGRVPAPAEGRRLRGAGSVGEVECVFDGSDRPLTGSTGNLYRIDADHSCHRMDSRIGISNTLA